MPNQPRTAWDTTATDPLQHTGWSDAPGGMQQFPIHTPAQDRGGDVPRDNGDIHFTRNKEKGLEKFDGKTAEFKPWRRRMINYIVEENESYARLMEWARIQKIVINENPHDFGGTEETKFGINVKEVSRKLYNFLCRWLGNTMEGRIDKCQESGLELWRSLSDEFDSQAAQMLNAKMKLYQNPVRTRNMEDLKDKFSKWEQLD